MHTARLTLLAAAIALTLSACGSDSDSTPSDTAVPDDSGTPAAPSDPTGSPFEPVDEPGENTADAPPNGGDEPAPDMPPAPVADGGGGENPVPGTDDSATPPAGAPADASFADPDPNAATPIARLGLDGARDLAADLALLRFVDVRDEVKLGAEALFGVNTLEADDTVSVDCPEGGRAVQTRLYTLSDVGRDITFADCGVGGRTIDGRWEYSINYQFRGNQEDVFESFDALDVTVAGATTTLSGATRSHRQTDTDEGRNCIALTDHHTVSIDIASARLPAAGGSTIDIEKGEYRFKSSDSDGANGDPECPAYTSVTFSGETRARSALFGAAPATFVERYSAGSGNDPAGAAANEAVLSADFGGGSTLVVTSTSLADGTAQVDIVDGGVAVSFEDGYAFELR